MQSVTRSLHTCSQRRPHSAGRARSAVAAANPVGIGPAPRERPITIQGPDVPDSPTCPNRRHPGRTCARRTRATVTGGG